MEVYSDNRREQTAGTHKSMNEPREHYAERMKPNPRDRQTGIWIPTLLFPGYVALGKCMNLSEP